MTSAEAPRSRWDLFRIRVFGRLRQGSGTWSWAFVAQGISSVTSLGLSLLAGRALGVSGLGVVFAGFTGYGMLLALHRALVSTPLISSSSRLDDAKRRIATRTAFTITLSGGLVCAGVSAAIGASVGGPVGDGLLAFSPWIMPAFAQELFRTSLFRDGRGRRAAGADIAWLATMVACAPFAAQIDAAWAVVAAWGLGSVVAASIGACWLRAVPMSPSVARTWFLRVAFPFGRWLALQEGSYVLGYYGLIVILTAILGVSGVGGLRAADSIFSPFTLLAPALMLVGLPATSRALGRSRESAVNLAAWISGATVFLTLAYAGFMLVAGPHILTSLYGGAFEPYGDLVVPLSVVQITLASGIGFAILLRAEQRGRANFVGGTSMTATSLVASTFLAHLAGVDGAVWGLAVGATVGSFLMIYFGIRGPRAKTVQSGTPQPTTTSV
jgi:O-antigen/teichoic acid export membrane protein